MFKNYLVVAWRNIRKDKGYAFINIAGLALGMACCFLISLWVQDELSFDDFHDKSERIFRVLQADMGESLRGATPYIVAPSIEADVPEVLATARLGNDPVFMTYGDNRFYEQDFYWCDPEFLEIFSFPLLVGDPHTALSAPNTIVITNEMAQKYFGDENPIGKVLDAKIYDGDREITFQVTGVMEDIPRSSHLQFDFLACMQTGIDIYRRFEKMWGFTWLYTYVLLPDATAAAGVEAKLPGVVEKHGGPEVADWLSLHLQPLSDIHLYSPFDKDTPQKGDITYVYIFSAVALFILLIASINFMNLATARSGKRQKEVGLRKVLGAWRSQLIKQFLGESILQSSFALFLAVGLMSLFLPLFNTLTGKIIDLNMPDTFPVLLILLGTTAVVSLVSGAYPAFFLSKYQPIATLKSGEAGRMRGRFEMFSLRKLLVTVQFSISMILIAVTIVVSHQLNYLLNKKLGFDPEQLLAVQVQDRQAQASIKAIKTAFSQGSSVRRVTVSSEGLPSRMQNTRSISWPGQPEDARKGMDVVSVDEDFFDMLGVPFLEGQAFSGEQPEVPNTFILNETARKVIGWDSAVGKTLKVGDWEGSVVGVVQDYHFKPLHQTIGPVVYLNLYGTDDRASADNLILRVDTHDLPATLVYLEKTWDTFSKEQPFEYRFVDANFASAYQAEEKLRDVFGDFAIMAIFIASLGLFGLAAFSAEQRTKEVGIRKVLGASVRGMVHLLAKDFVKPVLLGNVIAWPVAWYAMSRWLESFPYRSPDLAGIDSWWVFALAGGLTLMIALLTVSAQAIRAALANPIESLRYE